MFHCSAEPRGDSILTSVTGPFLLPAGASLATPWTLRPACPPAKDFSIPSPTTSVLGWVRQEDSLSFSVSFS